MAFVEDRALTDVIREAIGEYLRRKAADGAFRASLQRAIEENAKLITELGQILKPGCGSPPGQSRRSTAE